MRAALYSLLWLAPLACGPEVTTVLAPDDVDWVAAFGVGIDGSPLATPFVSTAGGAELSLDPRPAELIVVGLSEADLAPYEAHRARWTTDRVGAPSGCEILLPKARWAASVGADREGSSIVSDPPRFTTAWIDESRACDDLAIEVEVRCEGRPALCLPPETELGPCRFGVAVCAQIGGQSLEVELENVERACATEAKDCQPQEIEGKLVFSCPSFERVACESIVHVFDPGQPMFELSQEVVLPGDTPYVPTYTDPRDQDRNLLEDSELDLGLGSDFVVLDDLLVLVAQPDGRGGIAPNLGSGCPTAQPRAFFFFDAADGRRRPELDRPAPDCLTWLQPSDAGFFGLGRDGPEAFMVWHFDALGVQTSSLGISVSELGGASRTQAVPLAEGPTPGQALLGFSRSSVEGVRLGRSWVVLVERAQDGALRLRWKQDYAGIDDDVNLGAVGVVGADRVLTVDGAGDQFVWFDAANGALAGSRRLEPYEASGLRFGPTLSDRAARLFYLPVGRGRNGVITLDHAFTQVGIADMTRELPVSSLALAPEGSAHPVAFLYDPLAGRARATFVSGSTRRYLHPNHFELPASGPVRRARVHEDAVWALLPWSGRLLRLELSAP